MSKENGRATDSRLSKLVKVHFIYENQTEETFELDQNKNIKEVCLKFCKNNKINFIKVYFVFNGYTLRESDYGKSLKDFNKPINDNILSILVYNHEHSNDLNDDSCFLKYKKK